MAAYLAPDTSGTIVLLNGASCSGKTSIARAIQELMEAPWLHVGLDHLERETALVDGAWYGDVIMGILEHEYRAIRVTC